MPNNVQPFGVPKVIPTKRWIFVMVPSFSLGMIAAFVLLWWVFSRLPPEEREIRRFWGPFIEGGAVLVLAVPPLVFIGPDAPHEFEGGLPEHSLEVKPPQDPFYRETYGDFKRLEEFSEGEQRILRRQYPTLKPGDIVPYFVSPRKGYTGLGDARGLAEVMTTLLRIEPKLIEGDAPKLRVESADLVKEMINEDKYQNQNLIVLGGERANEVAKHFESLIERKYPNQRYHHVWDPPDGKGPGDFAGGQRIGTRSKGSDCGYLIRLRPNLLSHHGHVVIFDGFETAGTLATVYVTTRSNFADALKKINKQMKTFPALQVEVETKLTGAGNPDISTIAEVSGTLKVFKLKEKVEGKEESTKPSGRLLR